MVRVINANLIRKENPESQITCDLNNSFRFLNKSFPTKEPDNLDFPLEALNDFVLDPSVFLATRNNFRKPET